MESLAGNFNRGKPYLAVILIQFGYAGMSIIAKSALDKGMSPRVLAVYRHVVAALVIAPFAMAFERKVRPKMTLSIFIKISMLGLLEPTIDQNLYYTGMKLTTATFTSAMCNVLPAFAFLMAWIFRLEKVNIRRLHSQAKILGTIVTVGGAMLMTLFKGPAMDLPWTKANSHQEITTIITKQDPVKGALFISIGCVCWAGFIILQAITLKSYPAELSLTALICFMGALEGTIFALVVERGNAAAWALHLDTKLLAVVYGGVICSGITFYFQGVVMRVRGPVFVTAFNPLSMVLVAILSSFALAEIMYLGRILGAVVIIVGLYLVLWGKSKDQAPTTSTSSDGKISTINLPVTAMNMETIEASSQEFVTLDMTKVRPTSESV